ncbi:hypothetical protein IFM89_018963 [Coptis chinensis]|uniref:Histone acetyltransferase n=1 Tax=Coptis chinensis TaxID=261450 RepID=A0A835LVM0_9MAGN|nr:hypothetical protein IFM89_018963 [Coptis chinensis]
MASPETPPQTPPKRNRGRPLGSKNTPNSSKTSSIYTTENDPTRKRSNRHAMKPIQVGARIMCQWRDEKYHPAEIIERRKLKDGGPHCYEYYVHYTEYNRRLDEWVKVERIDIGVDQEVKGQAIRRGRKRKIEESEPEPEVRVDFKDLLATLRLPTLLHALDEHEGLDPATLREHEKLTKVKNIEFIELGRYEIETWYFSPFPEEFDNSPKLYFCEFCLNYVQHKEQLQRHMRKCDLRHPPGNEIYRSGTLSMFEVDGNDNRVYCQNLCYMAKLFLDHKTLLDDVDYFLFYILCECDDRGCHMVAYFSKEKQSEQYYNLACILTLPPYQRKGYGKFLIAFSYELSKKEGIAGTPEKPLSDLGKVSYKGYWTRVLLEILKKKDCMISVRELSQTTAIRPDDVFCTLKDLNLIQYTPEGMQYVCTDHNILDSHLKAAGPGVPKIDASKLMWTPYKEQDLDLADVP